MRVVVLCDFAVANGGAARVAIESALALAAAGFEVRFVHAVAGRDARLDAAGIVCVCLDLPDVWDRNPLTGAAAGVWNLAAANRLGAILADVPAPAVVHLHQWTRAFSPSVLRTVFASRLPLAVTAHDYFLACPNGVYYRFERQEPCSVAPLSLGCLAARCDPRSSAIKAVRVLRSAATAAAIAGRAFDIVHVSDRGRDTLVPLLPPQLRHHRIDNPIDVPPQPGAHLAPGAAFAFIGRLTREKGAVVAAAAAQRAGVPISFVGEGPAANEIRAINPRATLHGWQPAAFVAERLAAGAIRAVVAPSLWFETGPLTVYEAAAAGVPSIASDRCGASEHVKSGKTGFIVPPSIDALAAAMLRLDVASAQALGSAAHTAFWADPPGPAAHAARCGALYEAMLSRG